MIKLLVLPQAVFDQYKADGVQFHKLLCTNYIAASDVSSVNDLAEIDQAINEFPFAFGPGTPLEKADSPRTGIAMAATSDDLESYAMQKLQRLLDERVQTLALRRAAQPKLTSVYSLYPVDENLWVAVQKSLHNQNGDPTRLSIVSNRSFFDSMICELSATPGIKFEAVAASNIFTHYLESQV